MLEMKFQLKNEISKYARFKRGMLFSDKIAHSQLLAFHSHNPLLTIYVSMCMVDGGALYAILFSRPSKWEK